MTGTLEELKDGLGFDPEALHRKYMEERDKRLRKDANRQYVDMSGAFQEYSDDPYVEPGFTRDPVVEELDVLVLGGGFAGLMSAARLVEAGVKDLRVIEQAGDFGGTWYWNRYPGIRCDIEAYTYIPLLEEVGTIPTEKYAHGAEIFKHCQATGRHYGLYDRALFQTKVTSLDWSEEEARWIVRTDRDDVLKARFVVAGSGPLHRPKLPGIPGIQNFKGKAFHTSRWDYDFTGGDLYGNLDKLADKRVAIIGTGATCIQILPHVAAAAKQTIVFQRTPSAVDIRDNKPTDAGWFKSQEPGWQRKRMDNFVSILMGIPQEVDLVNDRWTDVWGKFATWGNDPDAAPVQTANPEELLQIADYQKMEEIRARIDEVVTDPAKAETLKPWYNLFCKRPLYSDEFLQAFNNDRVTLVDTHGRGVERITETGIVFDGVEYPVDGIIFATGFQVGAYTHESGGYSLTGRNGLTLAEKWKDGVRSVHGNQISGFPNFHIVGQMTQASVTVNYPHCASEQARQAAAIIAHNLKDGVRTMDVTVEAEERWAAQMAAHKMDRSKFEAECTPGYFNNEGDTKERPSLFGGTYGGGPFEYIRIMTEWREGGYAADTEITRL